MFQMTEVDVPTIAPEWIRKLSRREYHLAGKAGLFEGERVELLYGQVVIRSPVDPAHEHSCWTIGERLRKQLGDRAHVRNGLSFAASEYSEPIPDVMVVPAVSYWKEHPEEAFLVVEVSRTSLRKDLGVKARLYGEVNVQEYWVVDVERGLVHVYRDADASGAWTSHRVAPRGETIALAAFPEVALAVADILPPR